MTGVFQIRRAEQNSSDVAALANVLIDCVEGGASISFLAPLNKDKAISFWESALESMVRGERIILVAVERTSGIVVGTVQVILAMPENQPHRGEIAKLLVHHSARRHGLGTALMQAAVSAAQMAGKTEL
jgi:GNAT superfamily N-acetyltransferase